MTIHKSNAFKDRQMTCEHCVFWEQFHNQCRRHSPSALTELVKFDEYAATKTVSMWPITKHTDWCGDFELLVKP